MSIRQPIFNAPAIVVVLLGLMVAVHAGLELAGTDVRQDVLLNLALIPARYGPLHGDIPGGGWAWLVSPFSHMFLHGDVAHLIVNSAWFLAVGSVVARRLGGVRLVVAFVACGLAGAAAFVGVNGSALVILIGASGGISGLMAIVLRLLFSARSAQMRWVLSRDPRLVPRVSLGSLLTDKRALSMIAVWTVLNLVFAFGWSQALVDGTIAWEAHLGGFFCGLLLFGLIDTGPVAGCEDAKLGFDA